MVMKVSTTKRSMISKMDKSKIQMLYEACCVIFSQKDLPNFQQIQCLKDILDLVEAKDVGIDESSSSRADENIGSNCSRDISEITYIHIYECKDFSIGVFCFPEGGTFPLHDHPGMTVFSKLLNGSVHVKAYDWVKPDFSSSPTFGLAATVRDEILTAPCESFVLFPRSGGNIHSFTAMRPCAILDVLAPPYSEELGRPSTYFSAFPIRPLPGYVVLEEIDLPDDLVVAGAPYLGPPVDSGPQFF